MEITGDELHLRGSVFSRQATEYLGRQPRAHWPQFFARALEVGAFCLERASTSQDMEFVRRQADRLMGEVASAMRTIGGYSLHVSSFPRESLKRSLDASIKVLAELICNDSKGHRQQSLVPTYFPQRQLQSPQVPWSVTQVHDKQ
jgi:hypothetical protein